jgi:hypothetical protein
MNQVAASGDQKRKILPAVGGGAVSIGAVTGRILGQIEVDVKARFGRLREAAAIRMERPEVRHTD